ncbi:MAG: Cyclic nucleotide-binding domain [Deltaproteobacteria bacterium]|nr:Cyclic nucleotide-binding domain [Deltaproteobacteria bacterium]
MDTWQHALRTTLVDRMLWPAETAAAITQIAHIVEYEKGASVFHPGEPTDLLYLLLSGEARLYYGTASGERLLVHIVRGGQILGFTDFRVKDPHEHDSGQVFLAEVQSRSRVAIIAQPRCHHRGCAGRRPLVRSSGPGTGPCRRKRGKPMGPLVCAVVDLADHGRAQPAGVRHP